MSSSSSVPQDIPLDKAIQYTRDAMAAHQRDSELFHTSLRAKSICVNGGISFVDSFVMK